jgi:hypothetical protein
VCTNERSADGERRLRQLAVWNGNGL